MNSKPGKTRLEIAESFVLRTPLLPFSEFIEWGADTTAAADPGDEAAFDADTLRLRERLQASFARPEVRGALFVASPDLLGSLDQWLQSPDSPHGQKVERALVRYFSRMSARATPFGLFSGVSSGTLGPTTTLQLAPLSEYERHTRLDNDYLFALTEAMNREPSLRAEVLFSVNSSLYAVAGRLRYAEARLSGKVRSHHLVSVEPTPYLEAALECAAQGATRASIAASIVETDAEVELDEALAFVDEIIDSQILVTDIGPPVTGAQAIHHIMDRLAAVESAKGVAEALGRAQASIEAIDDAGLSASTDRYDDVTSELSELPATLEMSRLFQVDMVKPVTEATLGTNVRQEIERGIDVLRQITPKSGGASLRQFCDAFTARYQEAEIPLAEALDEEAGVGFASAQTPRSQAPPLLAGLPFPATPGQPTAQWDSATIWLFRRLCGALQRDERTLELTARDIEAMSRDDPAPLPDALSTMIEIAARSETALANGDFKILLASGGGPPGSRITGRFCHASSQIHAGVSDHLRAEEALQPDVVFAEIVHLPEGRVGNVLCRPVLREYEIPFLGLSGARADKQIPVSDLLVSVRQGRVVLRSRRLDRRVVPRLSTAHMYSRGLGVYRFLGALQNQGSQGVSWSWGPMQSAPFLPRVQFGKLVFQRASWQLGPESLTPLAKAAAGSKGAKTAAQVVELRRRVFRAVQQLRRKLDLPRYVALADGDNELSIDLDNALCVDSFAQLVKSRPRATLSERFPGAEDLVVRGPEGSYLHEINVWGVSRHDADVVSERSAPAVRRRQHPADSSWLSVKLYTGTATADDVLRRVVSPICTQAVARGDADRWFFVRYGDPDWHLRVRVHGEPARLHGSVLPALQQAAQAAKFAGMVWRVRLDSYEPEVDRYGGVDGIDLAEKIFAIDSVAVASIVDLLSGDAGMDARWRLTLRGADMLLDDLGLDLPDKCEIMRKAKASLALEFHVGVLFGKQLSAKYRGQRAELTSLLARDAARDAASPLAPGFSILAARSRALRPVVEQLRAREDRLNEPIKAMAWSLVHMHANRLLRSVARAQELVIYDFLRRHYESTLARARKK